MPDDADLSAELKASYEDGVSAAGRCWAGLPPGWGVATRDHLPTRPARAARSGCCTRNNAVPLRCSCLQVLQVVIPKKAGEARREGRTVQIA